MLTIQVEGLQELKRDFEKGVDEVRSAVRWGMTQATGQVQRTAWEKAPYKTGTLKRSILTSIEDNGFKGVVYQDYAQAKYGAYLEYGTKPYIIQPVTMKALYWKGALHPVRQVNHPGIKARPYMQPAFEQNIDKIQEIFEKAVERVINKIAG